MKDARRVRVGDWVVNAALLVAGIFLAIGMQAHAAADTTGAVTRGSGRSSPFETQLSYGRRLAAAGEKNEYEGALRTLTSIVELSAAESTNGISGVTQLVVSTVLVLVLGSLAAGAGIGGGGLFVPIYMVLLGAGPKGAVPLSKATILGGAIGNFVSISRQRHPKADRPMIDYEASTFMQSGELLGVVFGVLLNNLLPAVVIVVFLVLILSYNSLRTINKGIRIRKKETEQMEKNAKAAKEAKAGGVAAASASAGEDVEVTPATEAAPSRVANGTKEGAKEVEVSIEMGQAEAAGAAEAKAAVVAGGAEEESRGLGEVQMYGSFVDVSGLGGDAHSKADAVTSAGGELEKASVDGVAPVEVVKDDLAKIMDEDSKQFPLWAWCLLAPMTAYTVAYSLIKKVIQSQSPCLDYAYWLWYVTPVAILGGFMYGTAIILGNRHKRKLDAGFKYLPADIQWDRATLLKFPRTALLAGVTAGLLGIGGGMVIGPLFLQIGMEPQVGTSSCAFMILWTAFSGVVIYAVDEHLGWQLCLYCIGFGFVSGQIGQRLVNAVLKKTGRPSYVVFLLGSIIGMACLAMATTLLIKMVTGDYDANDIIEPGESVETHLFYLGTGFGCAQGGNVTTPS